MTARLTSEMLVGTLIRRVNNAGGSAMVLARGDATAGTIVVAVLARDGTSRLFERTLGVDSRYQLSPIAIRDDPDEYLSRRRSRDPDLWVVEVAIADGERFAAETIGDD